MKNIDKTGKGISIFEKEPTPGMVWDDTRVFLAVARHGTLSGAAESLNLGVATLSRRIERLEAALQLPLFVRQQSGYQLTEDGASLIEKAEALEVAAHAFASGAEQYAQVTGKVRLATAENLATGLILPALPAFHREYPDLAVELVTDIATANLHRRDADLAVRMVRPERGNVTLRRLGTLGYGLYCSEAYARRRHVEPDLGDYDRDDFITWSDMQSDLPAAQWMERVLHGRTPRLTTTSLATQVAATRAGLGLAVLPHFLAMDSGLICVATDLGIDQSIYLVIQSDLTQSPRVRVLADFLSDLVIRNRARLAGQG
ncbi:LysR family transcriptional regulator [Alkalilimnicola ehrlichii]|uniref:LysR family transcriptional regulator n=1 Tax=Alkalilimnicola ehrlichii TaxID=351052 RepID=A0A3E0WID5_9GAMM|nr:LysR family transcriptional regulator [Alkalilimnicola ehrlichii]RFA26611.1 LysR family transcriptional regulator [Alkalilimnicola ehrlichii]RFA31887.1 LysR family transcriptional regulator [Alkalilimnicola ehrlichii]